MNSSDLLWFKSRTVTNDATNGGRLSTNQIVSNQVQNTFPHLFEADRTNGQDMLRKVFAKIHYAGLQTASAAKIWQDIVTAADDSVVWFAGTQRDVAGDFAVASKRKYGAGVLVSDVAANASSFVLDLDHDDWKSADAIFRAGDEFRISDRPDPTNTSTGNEETGTIDTVTADASLNRVTITTVDPLTNGYTVANNTRAMSFFNFGDVAPTLTDWAEVDASASAKDIYDEGAHQLLLDCIGTDEEEITIEFTTASDFTVTGDTFGNLGSGSVSTDFTANHPHWARKLFTIEAAGWKAGTATGDKITCKLHPAAIPLWFYRRTPAGSGSLAGNKVTHVHSCESAV